MWRNYLYFPLGDEIFSVQATYLYSSVGKEASGEVYSGILSVGIIKVREQIGDVFGHANEEDIKLIL